MSRGVRDLRELICVSRLTVRGSDDEIASDEGDAVATSFDGLSLGSSNGSRGNSAASHKDRSSDSGIATNGISPEGDTVGTSHRPHPPSQLPSAARKKRRRKRKPLEAKKAFGMVSVGHDLPKASPLPPVRSESQYSWSSGSSDGTPSRGEMSGTTDRGSANYDQLLLYIDPTLVSEWLQTANKSVAELASWCESADNFVSFAHFWLSDFPDIQRGEIFKLEHSIILDHLNVALAAGRDGGQVKLRDVSAFLGAVFREYPGKLLSSKGPFLFLDHLDVLTSERQSCYKELLANVKVSTRNKQHAQWCLAVRAFSLVSVWTAVVNFYRRLKIGRTASAGLPLPATHKQRGDIHTQRLYQAIRNGYVDVTNYYIGTGKVGPDYRDEYGKTLVFTAVMHRQPKVLQYLLHKVKPAPDVNAAADTGNTPLHAAANSGDAALVAILVKTPGLNLDPVNPQCDKATPLHLAVLHGHKEVVRLLVEAGADTTALMDDQTPADIAQAFGHDDLLPLLVDRR